ncbi:MAG: type III pantothenate kinase [Deltaproteobacteria bacterium]|jgi:type III pantothenate kinase|nr:type III pantothenate kinase [Deltaproteobacteria bacterium]
MLMTMDVGNTNIKFGLWRGGTMAYNWRVSTRGDVSGDELGLVVDGALRLAGLSFGQVEDLIVASVVPPLRPALERFSNRYMGRVPIFVEGWSQRAMRLEYTNPREVGSDRVVASLAAWRRLKRSVIVVDFGTATTFDCVSDDGAYLGGAIAPGFRLSADALFRRASMLPKMESFHVPERALCKDTLAGLNAGLVLGYTALVEGLASRLASEMDPEPVTVATGGLAGLFASQTAAIREVLPDLTMEGLKIIYDEKKW